MNLPVQKPQPANLARNTGTGLGSALQRANGLLPSHVDQPDSGPRDSQAASPASTQKMQLWLFAPSAARWEALASQVAALDDLLQVRNQLSVVDAPEAIDVKANLLQWVPGRTLLLVDTLHPAEDMARFARRCLRGRSRLKLVFIGNCQDGEAIDHVLRAGARGVIPGVYDGEALTGALRMILSGQRFRPYLPHAAAIAPVDAQGLPISASAFGKQADQPLSPAELDVCRLVAQHLSDREIAEIRGTRRGTVRSQVTTLMRKLGCKRRDEAGEVYRRLHEVDDEAVQRALAGETAKLDWLLEFMEIERARKGQVLFRRGQTARKLYYLEKGEVRLAEIGTVMTDGVLFGEIGIFKPDQKRMHTAECLTDVDLRTLEAGQVWRYYQLKPQFAMQVLCLITRRLLADIERLRR